MTEKINTMSANLNPEQRQAVEHGVSGPDDTASPPVAVIAGAGSGKTKVLTARVVHLVKNGVDPARILAITFTTKAAKQIKSRVKAALAAAASGGGHHSRPDLPWAGTFHAVGTRLIRIHARKLGLSPDVTVLDRDDSSDLMKIVRQDLGLAERDLEFPKPETCLAIYSLATNSQHRLEKVLKQRFPWCVDHAKNLKKLFRAYVEAKREQGVIDYDDMLLHWADLMRDPKIAAKIGDRFDHVLVDEFQDTNVLQAEILRRLKPDGTGVFIVGDEAQSIYSFRAAEVRNILDFPAQFRPPARVIKLERNYRSTQPILDAANAVINLSSHGFGKCLKANRKGGEKPRLVTVDDGTGEALFVADEIEALINKGRPIKGIAVLVRAARHSAMLELELTRRGIKFRKFGGNKFTDAAHIKDLMAVLRWAENPTDLIAGMRALNLLPGIGPKTAREFLDAVTMANLVEALKDFSAPKGTREAWGPFANLMRRLHNEKIGWPGEVEAVRLWLSPLLPGLYPGDPVERAKDLEQLQRMATTFKSRTRFLTELALEPATKSETVDLATKNEDSEFITISTIHSVKGLEFASVYVVDVADGGLPSSRATSDAEIEEERRLLYVAMTRAERELTLVVPMHRQTFGAHLDDRADIVMKRSQFIPDKILNTFKVEAWQSGSDDEEDGEDTGVDQGPSSDIIAHIKRRWADR